MAPVQYAVYAGTYLASGATLTLSPVDVTGSLDVAAHAHSNAVVDSVGAVDASTVVLSSGSGGLGNAALGTAPLGS